MGISLFWFTPRRGGVPRNTIGGVLGIRFFPPSFELSYHFFTGFRIGGRDNFLSYIDGLVCGNLRTIPKRKREVIKDLSETSSISLPDKEKNQKHAPNNRDQ
jgi:hypothetical protein